MPKIQNASIYMQYGKAKEAEKQYADAAVAYEGAKDYDNVVRILVDCLHDIEGAAGIVRKTRSKESARLLVKLYISNRNFKRAVEFYLIGGMQTEAFEIAKNQNEMVYFAEEVKEEASIDLRILFLLSDGNWAIL